ncbi:hypothetical protein RHSIM_Rhsim01G0047100 [Rhododendron simsii]|uniref:GH18 domain-containing protein n=1 Tax=Rhododendron simsii TaxID=118357 RepID=A0A834LX28_RHOSS|nr:hypothetical protein RHSIM_Rhsim01G0047100 [Rhododendron simsii]
MAMAPTIPTLFLLFLSSKFPFSSAQTWIKSGYWFPSGELPVTDINTSLFTHLICGFASLNPSTYQLSISSSDAQSFYTFTPTVKQKNPTVTTLLSIGVRSVDSWTLSSMFSQSEFRKSFIESSIKTARSYGFDGLDLFWLYLIRTLNTRSEMANVATLFDEWRLAIESESANSSGSQLILTMAVQLSPYLNNASFPIESIKKNFNWVHVVAFEYYTPTSWNYTAAFAALYDPGSQWSTESRINAWIDSGLSANKLVLGLPFHGYAWTLVNSNDSAIGAPAKGPAITYDGCMRYKDIKAYMQESGAVSEYNAAYVVNYCVIGSSWIAYDDVEVVKNKVAYAKKRNLLGYFVSQVENDDENWVLSSQAALEDKKNPVIAPEGEKNPVIAQEDEKNPRRNKRHFLLIMLPTAATVTLVLVYSTCGYVPPEYVKRGIYSTKSDVYSFGVLLLQIISGKRNNCLHGLHEDLKLLDYAYDLWRCGKGMEFMDPSLDDTNSSYKLVRCMQIALLCVQENSADRPSMLELSVMLKNETASMNTPRRPAFSARRDEDEDEVQESTSQQEICGLAASDIDSTLFTHIFCAFADLDSNTKQVTISSSNNASFSQFTKTVQLKNPSVKTLLSIGGGAADRTAFASMASQSASRKSFIDSSIKLARSYGFHGLDLDWEYPQSTSEMANLGALLNAWRAAVAAEAKSSGKPPLLLTAAFYYASSINGLIYPVQSISNSLDWINLMAYDFYDPTWAKVTNSHAALYDPSGPISGSYGVGSWIQSGMSPKKLVLGMPFYGLKLVVAVRLLTSGGSHD